MEEILKINKKVQTVIESDISWETKYDYVFSKQISTRVFQLINLDYYDPDTTYKADVEAFANALNEYCKIYKNVF